MPKNWTEHELLVVMNLYCRIPFGQCNSRNKLVNAVAAKVGRTAGSVSRKLGNIASLDPRHQARGVGGLPNSSKLDRKIWNEFQNDWSAMAEKSEVVFEVIMQGAISESSPQKSKLPTGPSEIEQTVKIRRLQSFFRNAVLSSYDNRCALTGIAIPALLVASHIIPWSKDENRRADPTNGLCLNALHDKAFDQRLVTFDEKHRMVVSSELKKGNIPGFQLSNFSNFEGTKLTLPHRFAPDPLALEAHRTSFIP